MKIVILFLVFLAGCATTDVDRKVDPRCVSKAPTGGCER